MADQKKITLRGTHATPKNIVLRELPVATPSAGTTIRLKSLHATPKNIILGDPTQSGAAGPTFTLIASGGTYAFTGGDALFVKTPTFTLIADGASYAFSGGAALFALGRTLTADGGSFAYTGGAANFAFGRTLTADGGSYAYTGGAANFALGRTLTADGGAYAYAGGDANFAYGRTLVADGGTYAFTGGDALFDLVVGPTFTLLADGGTYGFDGGDALFTLGVAPDVTGGWPIYFPRRKRKQVDDPQVLEAATANLAKRQTLRQAEQRDQQITAQLRAIYAEQDALQAGLAQAEEIAQDEEDLEAILLVSVHCAMLPM
jgi:hypothetical protein